MLVRRDPPAAAAPAQSPWPGISLNDLLNIADDGRGRIHQEIIGRGLIGAGGQDHPARRLPPEVMNACILAAIHEYNETALLEGRPLFPDHAAGQESIRDYITGYGPITPYLRYENIEELWILGPDLIIAEFGTPGPDGLQHEPGRYTLPVQYASTEHLVRTFKPQAAAVPASWDASRPGCSATLLDGLRFEGTLDSIGKSVYVTLRHNRSFVVTLADLVQRGTLSPAMATFLDSAVKLGLTIIVAGGTASGKTSLLNALLLCLAGLPINIVTIEQQPELRASEPEFRPLLPQVLALLTREGGAGGTGAIDETELLRRALRMRPERIGMGEIRGPEALAWLRAAKTGHRGSWATIHADSCLDALYMLQFYCQMAGTPLTQAALLEFISRSVDLVVYLERDEATGQRRVMDLVEITGYVQSEGTGIGRPAHQSLFVWDEAAEAHRWTGNRPRCADRLLRRGLPLGIDLTATGPWPAEPAGDAR